MILSLIVQFNLNWSGLFWLFISYRLLHRWERNRKFGFELWKWILIFFHLFHKNKRANFLSGFTLFTFSLLNLTWHDQILLRWLMMIVQVKIIHIILFILNGLVLYFICLKLMRMYLLILVCLIVCSNDGWRLSMKLGR